VVAAGSPISGKLGVQTGTTVQLKSIQEMYSSGEAVMGTGIPGMTLFQLVGDPVKDASYSNTDHTEMLISDDQATAQMAGTMHHELVHLVLGDFGRSVPKGMHTFPGEPSNGVNGATNAAKDEAVKNAQQ
jgi:hypothetical protein